MKVAHWYILKPCFCFCEKVESSYLINKKSPKAKVQRIFIKLKKEFIFLFFFNKGKEVNFLNEDKYLY